MDKHATVTAPPPSSEDTVPAGTSAPSPEATVALIALANVTELRQSFINFLMVTSLARQLGEGGGWDKTVSLWDKETEERATGKTYFIIPDEPPLTVDALEEQAIKYLSDIEQEREDQKQQLLRTALLSRGYTAPYLDALTPEALSDLQAEESLEDIEDWAAAQARAHPGTIT